MGCVDLEEVQDLQLQVQVVEEETVIDVAAYYRLLDALFSDE
jgi:hypothetical protein